MEARIDTPDVFEQLERIRGWICDAPPGPWSPALDLLVNVVEQVAEQAGCPRHVDLTK